LNSRGFKKSKVGFVFPGTDIKELKKKQKEFKKKAKELFLVEEPPEPKMKIGAITAKGEAAMDFN
jgi:hypothetical protein